MIYYSDTAANGLAGWFSNTMVNQTGAPLTAGCVQGPFWVDPNHAAPGAGYLNLVAYAYRGIAGYPSGVLPDISMKGKKIVFDVTIEGIDLPACALLGVWIQGPDVRARNGQGRMMNIFQARDTICEQLQLQRPYKRGGVSTGWTPPSRQVVEVPFSLTPRDWVSLGSCDARADLYGHVEDPSVYGDILDNWVDLGVICLLGQASTPGLLGKYTFHKIEIMDA